MLLAPSWTEIKIPALPIDCSILLGIRGYKIVSNKEQLTIVFSSAVINSNKL